MKNVSIYIHRAIYTLYILLFFITPFLFYPFTHFFPIPWVVFGIDPQTYELFEFNKMYFVYGITILVSTLWLIRSIEEKRVIFKKTFLDYPLAFFLLSQVLSTILSLDIHTSIWGYYSRFHGGLLSSVCYALLYWALVSNLYGRKYVHHFLNTAILSATIVSWYGIAQHYGVDKEFWVQDVQARVFSSLGQPNWLAAFLVALIPVTLSYFLFEYRAFYKAWYLTAVSSLFICFLFTASRSGLLALILSLGLFASLFMAQKFTIYTKYIQILVSFLFFAGMYILLYYKFPQYAIVVSLISIALAGSIVFLASPRQNRIWIVAVGVILMISGFLYSSPDTFRLGVTGGAPGANTDAPNAIPQDAGGTETGAIRFIVWKGAWDIFTHYPILGSGVETFAYSFYQFRPIELLRTTEWDFLYNKAHNEYFNILATTGLFGVIIFILYVFSFLKESTYVLAASVGQKWKAPVEKLDLKVDRMKKQLINDAHTIPHLENPYYVFMMTIGIVSGFATILITNFFGFSVVNVALLYFLFPAFIAIISTRERFSLGIISRIRSIADRIIPHGKTLDWLHLGLYGLIVFAGLYLFSTLFNYWFADIRFSEARMLNRQGEIGQAHKQFAGALELRRDEPFYYSEIGWTEGEMVYSLMKQNDASSAADIVPHAENNSRIAVSMSPNNVLYWKKLSDTYYNLTFFDFEQYKDDLKKAADRTMTLAPTDASTLIVLSTYYERLDDLNTAIRIIAQSVEWKPDLAEGWNRLGELYFARYQKTKNENDKNKANEYRYKASVLDGSNEGYKKGFE
ncbi:MAG: O-antigen ligase family protein [bacterium]|nr:O-antigen ligase family protein [bacterium]